LFAYQTHDKVPVRKPLKANSGRLLFCDTPNFPVFTSASPAAEERQQRRQVLLD
jgi:hypothetical protein